MAISKTKKEETLRHLTDIFNSAKTIVFANFHSVLANEAMVMRNTLADEKVGYMVTKKTLLKRAFENTYNKETLPTLDGEIAIVYGEDSIAPARLTKEIGEKLENKLQIVGGVFEGKLIGKEEMDAIANIPPLQTLYAQLRMVLNSPIQKCAIAFKQLAEKK